MSPYGQKDCIEICSLFIVKFTVIYYISTMNNEEIQKDDNIPVMYVLVRSDIGYVHSAVQAGHAVAEYLLNHTPIYKGEMWKNGIMVYLSVKDESQLLSYAHTLHLKEHKYGMFTEPDWGEPQRTALATIAFKGEMFTELRTIKMPKGYLMWLRRYVYKIKRSLSVIYPFSPFVKDNR